jgi:hypothetical protein
MGMTWKRKTAGGLLAIIGYLLSPLSWWNDLFVNVPLAVAFAWVISLFYKPAFMTSAILGYWLTNVLGFFLMHKGSQQLLQEKQGRYSRGDLVRDLAVSIFYTALIVALVKLGILKPITTYFH